MDEVIVIAAVPQLQFFEGRRHHCLYAVADLHGPVQKTIEIPQFVDMVADFPCCAVVQISPGCCSSTRSSTPLSWRRVDPHGSSVQQTTEILVVAVHMVVDVLVILVVRVPQLPVMEETVVLPQLQLVELRP